MTVSYRKLRVVVPVLCGFGLSLGLAENISAAELCVGGPQPGCHATIQAAVDAAQNGDVVRIRPGTYAGGIKIEKSIELVGSGFGATTIAGGGPVITVGRHLGPNPPTVSIGRVTVTGGLSRVGFAPGDDFAGVGGGIYVPPSAGFAVGATVVLDGVAVVGNRAEPATTFPFPCAPTIGCQFGYAEAGGIANFGRMTVRSSRVSDNEAGGGVTSFASGGGIYNHVQGALTIERTEIAGNRLRLTRPNAIVASGGGITTHGRLDLSDAIVRDNSVSVETDLPDDVDTASFTGGIEVTDVAAATITRTIVQGNSVRMTNVGAGAFAGVGGISTDENVSLVLRDSTVAQNSVFASTSAPGAEAVVFAGGIELEGEIEVTRTRVIGNRLRAESPAGFTGAGGGGIEAEGLQPVLVTDSLVTGNSVSAVTPDGFALAVGGGIANGGLLRLRRTVVSANTVEASGPAGAASGGGIQNWVIPLPGAPPVAELTVIDSVVTGNRLSSSTGLPLQGGGIFASAPVTLTGTIVAGNKPDQCFGC
jgi:hypothetical protein